MLLAFYWPGKKDFVQYNRFTLADKYLIWTDYITKLESVVKTANY